MSRLSSACLKMIIKEKYSNWRDGLERQEGTDPRTNGGMLYRWGTLCRRYASSIVESLCVHWLRSKRFGVDTRRASC